MPDSLKTPRFLKLIFFYRNGVRHRSLKKKQICKTEIKRTKYIIFTPMFLHCKEDSKSTFLGVFERPQRITLEFVYVYIHLSEAIIFRNLLTARKSQREISTVKLSSKISHAYPAVLQKKRIQYSGVTYMTR